MSPGRSVNRLSTSMYVLRPLVRHDTSLIGHEVRSERHGKVPIARRRLNGSTTRRSAASTGHRHRSIGTDEGRKRAHDARGGELSAMRHASAQGVPRVLRGVIAKTARGVPPRQQRLRQQIGVRHIMSEVSTRTVLPPHEGSDIVPDVPANRCVSGDNGYEHVRYERASRRSSRDSIARATCDVGAAQTGSDRRTCPGVDEDGIRRNDMPSGRIFRVDTRTTPLPGVDSTDMRFHCRKFAIIADQRR